MNMIGGQIEDVNILVHTSKFNQGVIESTIEALRRQFNESGLSEDLLDRLKSSWEKKLKQNQQRQESEACASLIVQSITDMVPAHSGQQPHRDYRGDESGDGDSEASGECQVCGSKDEYFIQIITQYFLNN